jgi:F-type H+-transporting ATPase subunit c
LTLLLLLFAVPAFAQESGTATNQQDVIKWVAITSGFSMAIASALCGIAQAKATAAACEGLARNPGAAPAIRFALILALVLIESLALYTFAIVFLKVTAG